MSELDPLKELRSQIDAMDDRLVALLNERSAIVLAIGRIKKKNNSHFHTPAREQTIYDRLTAGNPGPFPNESLKHVFREIMGGSLSLEKEIRVAYLGPETTFAHQACLQRFSASVLTTPVHTIKDVFEAVEKGSADFGIVPVENATDGMGNDTLDLFVDSPLLIYGEVFQNGIRFLVLSQKPSEKTMRDKTSILFSVNERDKPGALYETLKLFSDRPIHFQSRPSKKKHGAYFFYIDIAGNPAEEKIALALKQVEKDALFLKVLGAYPMAEQPG